MAQKEITVYKPFFVVVVVGNYVAETEKFKHMIFFFYIFNQQLRLLNFNYSIFVRHFYGKLKKVLMDK